MLMSCYVPRHNAKPHDMIAFYLLHWLIFPENIEVQ